MAKLNVGDYAVLKKDIVGSATEDDPAFIIGLKGERVLIVGVYTYPTKYPYTVEGPTNPGQPWSCCDEDFES